MDVALTEQIPFSPTLNYT